MKKWKQKNVASFLVICMILSLFTGIPVNASQEDGLGEEPIVNANGLKVIDWLDFVDIINETTGESTGEQELLTTDDFPAYYNEDEELVKHKYATGERWTSFYGEDLWLDYVTEDGITTHVTCADITVTSPSGKDVTEEVASQHEIDNRVIRFQPTEVGRYTITYNPAEVSNSLTIYVGYPEVGFYTSTEANAEKLLKDDLFRYSDINKTFYAILQGDTIALSEEAPFKIKDWDVDPDPDTYITDETEIANYITYEEVETGIYEVTVNTNKYFGLVVTATVEDDPENPTRDRWISVEPTKIEGLVLKDWIDWSGEPSVPSINPNAEFTKEAGAELYGTTLYFAYVEKEGAEEVIITADNKNISISHNGEPADTKLVEYNANENNPDLIDFTFYEVGDYTVTYAIGDICSSVVIHVDYPVAAFYTTEEMSAAGFIRNDVAYDDKNRSVYYIVNDNPDRIISDTVISVNDWNKDDIEIETIEDNKKYKITVKENVRASFGLQAECNCRWSDQEVPESRRTDIFMYPEGGVIYTDGIEHLGYAGCYISEYEFETCNGINYNSGNSQYWVHADTIQGVIDKLAAVSEGEEVLFNPDDPDDTATGIVNTGYIHINVSHFGNIQLEPQYISSSGNMKGIQFEAGNDHYFTIPDEKNHPLTEDGIYIEDALFFVTDAGRKEFSALSEVDIVSHYCGALYAVEERTTDNGSIYYSLDDMLVDSETMETIDDQTFANCFEEYWMPAFQFPELHVNMYSDMKFAGNMSKLYIGFKDGEDYEASIFSRTENGLELEKTYSKDDINQDPETIDVVYDDIHAKDGTGYSTSTVTVNLYKIASTSQSDESSTYVATEGGKVTVEVPEPNALTGLSDAQKTAIESGKELTVSIKADTINPATATDSVKTAITNIRKTVEKEIGKNAVSTFLDLSVLAKVDTIDEETQITETKAPMTVTVPLTKELQGRKNYAIVRYHDGIGGHVDVLTAKLSKDGKSLVFDTDRFSVYAIVYEKEDLDLSKVAWNYKDAFTYDGSAKTVELTGLPKGLTATYTGNTATEPGTYTAQVTFSYDDTVYNAPDVSKISSLQWKIVKEATPVPPSTPSGSNTPSAPDTPADTTKTGDTATVDGNNYTVTSVADNQKTVTYTTGDKTTAKIAVPATVVINGTTYQVTAIADNAFKGSSKLTSVTIPSNVISIGKNAFSGCKKLTKVTMGSNVTTIGDNAFSKCTALKSITIPAAVNKIGKQAFAGCKKLSKITIKTTKLTSKNVGSKAFKGISTKATIKVPKSKLASYKKLLKAKGVSSKAKIKK